jgi:YidC/Oxa1 family membrane protein insertase
LGLYAAVRKCAAAGGRFFWIPNIALPDVVLTLAVMGVTYATVALGTSSTDHNRTMMIALPTLLTFFFLSNLAAGVGVYWGASSLIGLFQAALLRRERAPARTS